MTRVLMWYVVWCACAVLATPYSYAAPTSGMVATVNPLATDAGVDALQNGGNAVDAAIAAALTLGVVDSHNSGIGGGCFILVRQADGKLLAIDGREMAPAKATRNMYLRDGKPQTELSKTGALASGVPGALAAYDLVLKKSGRKGLGELILPAATIAEKGFPIGQQKNNKFKIPKQCHFEFAACDLFEIWCLIFLFHAPLRNPNATFAKYERKTVVSKSFCLRCEKLGDRFVFLGGLPYSGVPALRRPHPNFLRDCCA